MHLRTSPIRLFAALILGSYGLAFSQTDTTVVAQLLHQLGNADGAARWSAISALVSMGSGAVPSLTVALADTNERVRSASAVALRRIGKAALPAEAALAGALADPGSRVREEAAAALGTIGSSSERTIAGLIRCLADQDLFVAGKAAGALGSIGAPAVPALTRTLGAADRASRQGAAIAFSKIGAAGIPAVPALIGTLADSSENIRYVAAHALGRLGSAARTSVPALLRTLSDPDQDVRTAATLALQLIEPEAVEFHGEWKNVATVIDTLTPPLMHDTHVPGVTVALVHARKIVWAGQYGMANATTGAPVTENSMFEACSMSKPVLACIALRLAEKGKLDLDRPLIRYLDLPSLRAEPGHERITARMVLSHTTGLPNWRKGDDERDGPLPVNFPPGSRFGYSGEAIFYLQQVIETITGEPFDIFARRELFGPAGLEHMDFSWSEGISHLVAGGHNGEGTFIQTSRYFHPNAAYTLYTSASAYAQFLIGLMMSNTPHRGLLHPRSSSAMFSHQVAVPAREPVERPGRAHTATTFWGLGWGINTTGQGDIIYHSGANQSGFRCFAQFNPSTGSGIVIMTNGYGGTDLWTRLIARIGNF